MTTFFHPCAGKTDIIPEPSIDYATGSEPVLKLDPDIKQLADHCVMCGLCLPHCPTYNKTQNEAESPRGRISLIQALASGRLEADDKLCAHLDNCLLCRACEVVCPSGVEYGAIMDGARDALAAERPLIERPIAIKKLALDKTLQRQEARRLWLAEKSGLRAVGRGLGITKALGLERFERLAPSISKPHDWRDYYPAAGDKRGDVALFTGCFGDMFDQVTLDAAIRVLNACGYGVNVPPSQTCCGALHRHSGDRTTAERLAQQNLAAFAGLAIDAVISCASGCGSQLQEYKKSVGRELPVCDISTFLDQIEWPEILQLRPLKKRVAVHDPCSLRNVLKEEQSPYRLLRRIPALEIVPLPGNEQCCGAAGSYMIDHPGMADSLRDDKLEAIRSVNPDILVSSNIGCTLHLAAGAKAGGIKLEVLHPVTLLARQVQT
jgi:glycolate oxidase iron-sulfur subunit